MKQYPQVVLQRAEFMLIQISSFQKDCICQRIKAKIKLTSGCKLIILEKMSKHPSGVCLVELLTLSIFLKHHKITTD